MPGPSYCGPPWILTSDRKPPTTMLGFGIYQARISDKLEALVDGRSVYALYEEDEYGSFSWTKYDEPSFNLGHVAYWREIHEVPEKVAK